MFVISKAPLRISLAGGGTDQPEYFMLPGKESHIVSFAIDKYIWVTFSERWQETLCVSYRKFELALNPSMIKHDLVRTVIETYGLPESHFEAHIISNMPGTTGLGSSSALSVALVKASYAWQRMELPEWDEITRQAWLLEREANHTNVGVQDHAAAASAGAYHYRFSADMYIRERLPLQYLFPYLIMVEIAPRRISASDILDGMAANIVQNEAYLNEISKLAQRMAQAITMVEVQRVGELLEECWQQKKCLHPNITDEIIDESYSEAKALGVIGGKLCGAGSGGFLLLLAHPSRHENIRKWLLATGKRELRIGLA